MSAFTSLTKLILSHSTPAEQELHFWHYYEVHYGLWQIRWKGNDSRLEC